MWEIPEPSGAATDKTYVYQGVGVRNLEQAVLQGWAPVKEEEKVGTNWPAGPNGFRMIQEQVLCKMPRSRWNKLQEDIDAMKEALSIEHVETRFREETGGSAYGEIKDG